MLLFYKYWFAVYPKFDTNAIVPETKSTTNVTNQEEKQTEDRRPKHRCPLGYRLSRDDTCEGNVYTRIIYNYKSVTDLQNITNDSREIQNI